jgi:CHAT domain-containing protein
MLARMMERRNGQIAAADGRELAADKQSAIKQPTVKQPCSYLAYFEAHALRFYALLRCNQIGELRQMLDAMEEKFAPTESEWIRARLYLLRGIVNYYEGRDQALAERSLSSEIRFRQAEEHLAQAAARFEMLGVKPEVWQAQRVLLWCQKHLSKDPAAIAELRDQAGDLLDELVQSLPPAERAFLVVDNLTADEEALVDKVARIEELRQVLSELPGSRWMTVPRKFPLRVAMARLIHELLLDIDRQKGALSRRVIEGRDKTPDDAPPLTFWQRLWQHPRGRATLSFLVLPDFTVAIRSGFLMLQLSVSQIKRSEVRDFVRGWHLNADPQKGRQLMGLTGQRNLRPVMVHQAEERLKRESQVREFDFNEIATVIAHALSLPHLLQDLPPGTALTIVPDDSLHGFPFAATRINGRSLIEAFPISLAFESKLRAAALAPPALQQTLLVAVPHGWENPLIKGERYDPLPGTLDELARVNEWFKRKPKACAQRLGSNDKRVGKKELLHQLSTSTFFHIACHGQSDPDSPDQSGLVLMPEEGRMEVFTLRELSALTLGGLRHATLSSCWSADNFVLPGRWVISLPETLWRAGAHSILGSLWEVSDEIAIAFMHRFYQYLEKHPRDLALRQTQLDCKNGTLLPGNEETVKPENWAGYNLYGDYRVLRFDDGDERQGIWQRLLDRLIQREK